MVFYDKIVEVLYKLLIWFCVVLFIIMSFAVFGNVMLRFVFHYSLPWMEELARYLLIYITFLGAAIVQYDEEHLNLDLLTSKLRGAAKKIDTFVVDLLLFGLLLAITYYGFKYSMVVMKQPTPAMRIPLGLVYMVLPVSTAVMDLMLIPKLIRIWKKGDRE